MGLSVLDPVASVVCSCLQLACLAATTMLPWRAPHLAHPAKEKLGALQGTQGPHTTSLEFHWSLAVPVNSSSTIGLHFLRNPPIEMVNMDLN